MMNKTVKSVAKNVLKFLVSAAAIWWVMSKISFNEVVNVFSTANVWYLLLALLFVVFSMVLSAFRQNLTLRITGANLSQMLNIKLFWLGLFYNLFLPGGIGGDGYKVYLIHKYRKNGIKSNIGAMLVNRISGLVAIGVITVSLYYLSGIRMPFGNWYWLGIPAVYLLYLVVLKYFFRRFYVIHFQMFYMSMGLQMLQFVSAIFILMAFHQMNDQFDYLFLFFLSAVTTALPVTIGGIGAREMVFLIGAKYLLLDNELSVALSIMFFLLSAFTSLWGIYWVFFPPFRRENIVGLLSDKDLPITQNELT